MLETLQYLRRTHRARGKQRLEIGIGLQQLLSVPEFDTGNALASEAQTPHQRAGDDLQVGATQRRAQKTLGGIPAHAAFLVDLEIAAALVVAAVEVDDFRNADLGCRIAKRV